MVETELRERPIGELLHRLSEELHALLARHIALVEAEGAEKKRLAVGAALVGGLAATAAVCSLAALTAFFVFLLAYAMPLWLAALVVALLAGAAAALLALNLRARLQHLPPAETLGTLREDLEWIRTRLRFEHR